MLDNLQCSSRQAKMLFTPSEARFSHVTRSGHDVRLQLTALIVHIIDLCGLIHCIAVSFFWLCAFIT
jgi:hypothetical protein